VRVLLKGAAIGAKYAAQQERTRREEIVEASYASFRETHPEALDRLERLYLDYWVVYELQSAWSRRCQSPAHQRLKEHWKSMRAAGKHPDETHPLRTQLLDEMVVAAEAARQLVPTSLVSQMIADQEHLCVSLGFVDLKAFYGSRSERFLDRAKMLVKKKRCKGWIPVAAYFGSEAVAHGVLDGLALPELLARPSGDVEALSSPNSISVDSQDCK
jgi:hypothetical protein